MPVHRCRARYRRGTTHASMVTLSNDASELRFQSPTSSLFIQRSSAPPIARVDFLAFLLSSCPAPTQPGPTRFGHGPFSPSRAQQGMIGALESLFGDWHGSLPRGVLCTLGCRDGIGCCRPHGKSGRRCALRASCQISGSVYSSCPGARRGREGELELPFHGHLRHGLGILPSRQPDTRACDRVASPWSKSPSADCLRLCATVMRARPCAHDSPVLWIVASSSAGADHRSYLSADSGMVTVRATGSGVVSMGRKCRSSYS